SPARAEPLRPRRGSPLRGRLARVLRPRVLQGRRPPLPDGHAGEVRRQRRPHPRVRPRRRHQRPPDAHRLLRGDGPPLRPPLLVGPNAPFRGLTYQPLTPGVGYGVLRFVRAAELATAPLGPDVIVVTDDV